MLELGQGIWQNDPTGLATKHRRGVDSRKLASLDPVPHFVRANAIAFGHVSHGESVRRGQGRVSGHVSPPYPAEDAGSAFESAPEPSLLG
jgi:hypothetical protein